MKKKRSDFLKNMHFGVKNHFSEILKFVDWTKSLILILLALLAFWKLLIWTSYSSYYTPGIYAKGYIVFVFPFVCSFVCSFVRSFVRTSFRRVEFASKFCVKVSQVVYISATTHQKAFIFGP